MTLGRPDRASGARPAVTVAGGRPRARTLAVAALVAMSACARMGPPEPGDRRPDARTQAVLKAARADLQDALRRGDRGKLEALLDDSFLFVHSTGRLESRAAFVDRMVQAGEAHRVPEIEFTADDIRLYGDTAVWITHSARRGTPIAFVGTDVLVRSASGWKWVSVHSTRIEPAP